VPISNPEEESTKKKKNKQPRGNDKKKTRNNPQKGSKSNPATEPHTSSFKREKNYNLRVESTLPISIVRGGKDSLYLAHRILRQRKRDSEKEKTKNYQENLERPHHKKKE